MEGEITELEQHICKDSHLTDVYNAKCESLRELQKRGILGAQSRARYQYYSESDISPTSSKFKCMSHLNLEDGSTVYISAVIVHQAREYYRRLYSPEPVDVSGQDLLLSGLSLTRV